MSCSLGLFTGGQALWDTAPTQTKALGAMGRSWAWSIFQGILCFPADVSLGYSLPINTDENTEPVLEKGEVPVQSCWEMAPGAISGQELGSGCSVWKWSCLLPKALFLRNVSALLGMLPAC